MKEKDFCVQNNIAHAWKDGSVLATYPPIYTRVCTNCGQEQRLRPAQWEDYPRDYV